MNRVVLALYAFRLGLLDDCFFFLFFFFTLESNLQAGFLCDD